MHVAVVSLRLLIVTGILWLLVIALLYVEVPRFNAADLEQVDVLIVLGCPTMPNGSPAEEQRSRVSEAVREYRRGVSRHMILTGGAAHSLFVEADAMAALARNAGVPPEAITEETAASDTIENIEFSVKIMRTKGWRTVEVISSPSHMARAALILSHYPELRWRTQAAEWPNEYTLSWRGELYLREALATFVMRIPGVWPARYLLTNYIR